MNEWIYILLGFFGGVIFTTMLLISVFVSIIKKFGGQ